MTDPETQTKMIEELLKKREQIGDAWFSIAPQDMQHKEYPFTVYIMDAEGDVWITIKDDNCLSEDYGGSLSNAEALVDFLNFDRHRQMRNFND